MTVVDDLQERYQNFVAERNWEQFHTPKNLAEALSVESSELLELFLWHDNLPAEEIRTNEELLTRIEEELADVLIYSIALATQLDIDLIDAVEEKMADNETRFDDQRASEITEDLRQWQRD
ncbi:nucleotide pyrophosphohydrolase [haloarchaeon 3A1-DGR]|nr:nucleotide pyrophosphohydrolase [haloarchaeon 3A1-DGR]